MVTMLQWLLLCNSICYYVAVFVTGTVFVNVTIYVTMLQYLLLCYIICYYVTGKVHRGSLMISDASSDEETLFVNQKNANGHLHKTANGVLRSNSKNKLKT